jgi:hypothetical protein
VTSPETNDVTKYFEADDGKRSATSWVAVRSPGSSFLRTEAAAGNFLSSAIGSQGERVQATADW